jgi:flavin-dependent dehydrogenase
MSTHRHDVLVVGGGPAGAATAYWLAGRGHDVAVLEKKTFPREKACGDGLTPRAVKQLRDMGLEPTLARFHRFEGLRALAHGIRLDLEWPDHPDYPSYGYVVRRRELDQLVARRAVDAGATIRGYVRSPMHDDPWIESTLDVHDRQGNSLPGYGWVFPVGDGWINVGVGLLSTFRDYKRVNTTNLIDEYIATLPEHWGVTADSERTDPVGGRLPMAGSVHPKVGPTWIVVGDAAGSVNPFNGEGIDYAYETGRLAATLLDEALVSGDALALARYPRLLDQEYGLYFKVARLFAHLIGNPALMRELTLVGMQSRTLMEWVLRIMANLLQRLCLRHR